MSLMDGPLSAATKAVPHGLVCVMRDLDDAGLDAGFVEQVSRDLSPGGSALLADVDEVQPLILDRISLEHGGQLLRHRLAGSFAERRLIAEIRALRQELARLEARIRTVTEGDATSILYRSKGIELAHALRRAKGLAAALRQEATAKANVLQKQVAQLGHGAHDSLRRRAVAVQATLERRAELLERAAGITPAPPRRASKDDS
jgi:hypothetical protein